MADTKVPKKKKKTFAFLNSAPRPDPIFDFEDDSHTTEQAREGEEEDDLALFKRSKDFFSVLENEQVEEVGDITRQTKTKRRKYDSDDDNDDDATKSPPSSSKRRKSSLTPMRTQKWRESTEDLYGATPLRQASKSPARAQSTSDSEEEAMPRWGSHKTTSKSRSQTRDSVERVESDVLPTPRRSGSTIHKPAREVVSIDDKDDEDLFGMDEPVDQAASPSPRKDRASASTISRKDSTPAAIILDSDEESEPAEAQPPVEEDEYEHLIKRAQEREAAAKAAAAAMVGREADDNSSAVDEHGNPRKKRTPVIGVKVLIYSRLGEDVALKPFGAIRGISQDLGYVRQHFIRWACQRGAPISEELADQIFLTWKGRRIYDTSTGISLGWPLDRFNAPPQTPGFVGNGILLEAWTEESYTKHMASVERQKMIERGDLVEEEEVEEEKPEGPKLRLTLKEKDAEPLKTAAYEDLEVRLLICAYRRQRAIPNDRDIRLRYEGEWLDPSATLKQSDVEDHCTIEVYLK